MKTVTSVLATILAISPAFAGSAPPASPPASPPAFPPKGLSHADQQVYDQGFHDCAHALDRFVRFVHTNDDTYATFAQWGKENTNSGTFTTTSAEGDGSIIRFQASKTVAVRATWS